LLKEEGIPFTNREYTKDPLSEAELREVFAKLGARPKDLLRPRDKAYGELGLTGDESDDTLFAHMAAHPTLVQRPIGILGDRAVIGRPHTELLKLVN
jgi:arsenate reductase